MPQASSPLPKLITLVWGTDHLAIYDPIWIEKIVGEMAQNAHLNEYYGIRLLQPRSRAEDETDANMRALVGLGSRYVNPNAPPELIGYQAPEQHWPVAVEALKVFLGLEMPVALKHSNGWSDRSESHTAAVYTSFRLIYHTIFDGELKLCWAFSGYQIYATHHIGRPRYRPIDTDYMSGRMERRLLNGQWVRWGFDGASTPPRGRSWSSTRRLFVMDADGIRRIDPDDTDLEPVYDDEEESDGDVEAGLPQSQADL